MVVRKKGRPPGPLIEDYCIHGSLRECISLYYFVYKIFVHSSYLLHRKRKNIYCSDGHLNEELESH